MRAILIDPVKGSVSEVEYTGETENIHEWLSDTANGLEVNTLTAVNITKHDTLFVDDEGLLKEPRYLFEIRDYPHPLAGRGLILGLDGQGESVATELKLQDVKARLKFGARDI